MIYEFTLRIEDDRMMNYDEIPAFITENLGKAKIMNAQVIEPDERGMPAQHVVVRTKQDYRTMRQLGTPHRSL